MIKKEDIEKLAELSRIDVTEEEVIKFSKDFESILEYVNELNEVTAEEIEKEAGTLRNVLRKDSKPHEKGMYTEALLSAAPERKKNYLKVKKILE